MEIEDRRTFERLKVELPLKYSKAGSKDKAAQSTYDISAEGLGFVSDDALLPGIEVDMSLSLPRTNEEFTAHGKVVWSRKSGKKYRVGIVLEQAGLMAISTILRLLHLNAS